MIIHKFSSEGGFSMRILVAIAALLILAGSGLSIEPVLPRHPAPSPDGTAIAFSWQGDI